MNKSELIAALAEKTEFSKKDAEKALNAFVDVTSGSLAKGGTTSVSASCPRRAASSRATPI